MFGTRYRATSWRITAVADVTAVRFLARKRRRRRRLGQPVSRSRHERPLRSHSCRSPAPGRSGRRSLYRRTAPTMIRYFRTPAGRASVFRSFNAARPTSSTFRRGKPNKNNYTVLKLVGYRAAARGRPPPPPPPGTNQSAFRCGGALRSDRVNRYNFPGRSDIISVLNPPFLKKKKNIHFPPHHDIASIAPRLTHKKMGIVLSRSVSRTAPRSVFSQN